MGFCHQWDESHFGKRAVLGNAASIKGRSVHCFTTSPNLRQLSNSSPTFITLSLTVFTSAVDGLSCAFSSNPSVPLRCAGSGSLVFGECVSQHHYQDEHKHQLKRSAPLQEKNKILKCRCTFRLIDEQNFFKLFFYLLKVLL